MLSLSNFLMDQVKNMIKGKNFSDAWPLITNRISEGLSNELKYVFIKEIGTKQLNISEAYALASFLG